MQDSTKHSRLKTHSLSSGRLHLLLQPDMILISWNWAVICCLHWRLLRTFTVHTRYLFLSKKQITWLTIKLTVNFHSCRWILQFLHRIFKYPRVVMCWPRSWTVEKTSCQIIMMRRMTDFLQSCLARNLMALDWFGNTQIWWFFNAVGLDFWKNTRRILRCFRDYRSSIMLKVLCH